MSVRARCVVVSNGVCGQDVTILTDHSAVAPILQKPGASGKHARWWLKVHASGIRNVTVHYRPGRENSSADALSRSPVGDAPPEDRPVVVAHVDTTGRTVSSLLQLEPETGQLPESGQLKEEQRKDPRVLEMIHYLETGTLPTNEKQARKIAAQEGLFALVEGVLYYIDPKKQHCERAVVPGQLRKRLMQSVHGGPFSAHFSGNRLFNVLSRSWWWEGMFKDCRDHCKGCPQCCIVQGGGKLSKPIPVSRPFQILGIDVVDLPVTERGNKHVLVLQDFLTKWPWVFPIPDQKTVRIVDVLVKEIIPVCGVPECLLSDRGTNLLSHLMADVCSMMGITKLNTTAYHPQCDGLTERFNRTLKTMIRKHVNIYGKQWDQYLHGLLWAYRNTPHEATGEKPSFLLYGRDCRYPIEASFLPVSEMETMDLTEYRRELTESLAKSQGHAAQSIQRAQKRYKSYYDKVHKCSPVSFKVGAKYSSDSLRKNLGSNASCLVPGTGRIGSRKSLLLG